MLSQNVLSLEGQAQNPEEEDGVQVQWQEVLTTLQPVFQERTVTIRRQAVGGFGLSIKVAVSPSVL